MSNVSTEGSAPAVENATAPPPIAESNTAAVPTTLPTHTNGLSRARYAITLVEKHPWKAIAAGVAAGTLIELEFALGLLAGIGATLLFVTRTGPEARRELVDKGKLLLGRARSAFAEHSKAGPPEPQAQP
jgi:hypothetical protein